MVNGHWSPPVPPPAKAAAVPTAKTAGMQGFTTVESDPRDTCPPDRADRCPLAAGRRAAGEGESEEKQGGTVAAPPPLCRACEDSRPVRSRSRNHRSTDRRTSEGMLDKYILPYILHPWPSGQRYSRMAAVKRCVCRSHVASMVRMSWSFEKLEGRSSSSLRTIGHRSFWRVSVHGRRRFRGLRDS